MSPLLLLSRNLGKKQMKIANLCRNSGKTCQIDQRWLLVIASESAVNDMTRPQWQSSPRVCRPFLAHWVPGIILCTGKLICALKHICALKNIFVHWQTYLCTEKYICALANICALKNIFVHWKIHLCIEKYIINVLRSIFMHWNFYLCIAYMDHRSLAFKFRFSLFEIRYTDRRIEPPGFML